MAVTAGITRRALRFSLRSGSIDKRSLISVMFRRCVMITIVRRCEGNVRGKYLHVLHLSRLEIVYMWKMIIGGTDGVSSFFRNHWYVLCKGKDLS